MTATDSYTPRERAQRDADGGFSARLAISLEHAAGEARDLPEDLMAAGFVVHFYAMTGTAEDRRAQVDAWAARHHVKACWLPGAGYVACVYDGALTMMAQALPVLEALDVPAEDTPRERQAVAA